MEQEQIFKRYLLELGIRIPNSEVRRLLDTPIGYTLRGISDALDSLHIENTAYHLPSDEYLSELEFPYLMLLLNANEPVAVITNERDKQKYLPFWEGIVLVAHKTDHTKSYKLVILKNIIDYVHQHHIKLMPIAIIILYAIFLPSDATRIIHSFLCGVGIITSFTLLKRDYYQVHTKEKFCKIGNHIDCDEVLNSDGSRFMRNLRLSDLACLFFTTLFMMSMMPVPDFVSYSILVLGIGTLFTIYSIVYQTLIINKICLFCMLINVLVWMDLIILLRSTDHFILSCPYILIISDIIAYIIWHSTRSTFTSKKEDQSYCERLSMIYRRDVFESLLEKEREIEDIPEELAEVRGLSNSDNIITVYVHPKCNNCKEVLDSLPLLADKAKLKIISLASYNTELIDFCRKHQLCRTPTVLVNNHELPSIYQISDLQYII